VQFLLRLFLSSTAANFLYTDLSFPLIRVFQYWTVCIPFSLAFFSLLRAKIWMFLLLFGFRERIVKMSVLSTSRVAERQKKKRLKTSFDEVDRRHPVLRYYLLPSPVLTSLLWSMLRARCFTEQRRKRPVLARLRRVKCQCLRRKTTR
jgi:hypothetical protein